MSTVSYISVPTSFARLVCGAALLWLCAAATGCETSQTAERSDAQRESPDPSLDTETIVEEAEAARDRSLEAKITFERVEDTDKLEHPGEVPGPVAEERSLIVEALFGERVPDPTPAPGSSKLAVYDPESKTVRYRPGESNQDTRSAVFAAVVRAIDEQQFDGLSSPETWDEYLAQQTAKTATIAFSLAANRAATHDDVDPDLLAKRPELVTRFDGLDFGDGSARDSGARGLSALEREFVRREAWPLAAALYRANGWSGVELAWLMPPARTADVVQPGNWLSGAPVARWIWPHDDTAQPDRKGSVGAAVTSFWLSETVSAAALRTLFAGWTSDRYRYWKKADERPERFEWLTLWDSPASASQVTKAFELTLRQRFPDNPDAHFVVFQKGLEVGVIISDEPQQQRRERAREILGAKVQFESREGLPISFVPTRSDVVTEKAAQATLEDGTWTDPASGLRMDVTPLDNFKVDQPSDSAVRWFARGPGGALVQLTMEMADPMGPKFGGETYRDNLRKAFTQTLEDTDISGISNVELAFGRTLQATVSGTLGGESTRIQFWHFKIDDLIFTYSYQAPAEVFGEFAERAKAVIQSTTHTATPANTAPKSEETGIIEFEVEKK